MMAVSMEHRGVSVPVELGAVVRSPWFWWGDAYDRSDKRVLLRLRVFGHAQAGSATG
jgi:hypothetical protein